jgi:hypothetical protein
MSFFIILILNPLSANDAENNPYARKGIREAGGIIALRWGSKTFFAEACPSFGYFITDRIELSTLLSYGYAEINLPSGEKNITRRGDLVLEPSYHHPLSTTLNVFRGLGYGIRWDDSTSFTELVPRIGLNSKFANANVISPAIRMPLEDSGNDSKLEMVIAVGSTF